MLRAVARALKKNLHPLRIAILALMVLGACALSPTGRRQLNLFPDDQMAAMGHQTFQSLKKERTIAHDASTQHYVECVTAALTAELDPQWQNGWEVVVFEDPSPNAFALPGRKIGVHTGMLEVAQTQDQLAAVLGHEIGHVMARHGNERLSQQQLAQIGLMTAAIMTDPETPSGRMTLAAIGLGAEYGVLLPFSRAHESEADQIGLVWMAQAGFDPSESVVLWENMAAQSSSRRPPEWMSTHPSTQSRISDLAASLPEVESLSRQAAEAGRIPDCRSPHRAAAH